MNAHRVHVFNGTDNNDVVVGIAQQLELKLLPSHQGLVDNNLVNGAGLEPALQGGIKLFFVPNKTGAAAPKGKGGPNAKRIAKLLRDFFALEVARSNLSRSAGNVNLLEQVFELLSVFGDVDGLNVYPDDLNPVLLPDSLLVGLDAKV